MTPEKLETLKVARTLKAQQVKSTRSNKLTIGDYVVWQFDDSNWVVNKYNEGESTYRYYPSIKFALSALLTRLIGDKSKLSGGVEAIILAITNSEKAIINAVSGV